jgi:carboxylesterase type B
MSRAVNVSAVSTDENTEQTDSVGSDVYLLKDSFLEDDEQGVSDSLDGSDDIEPTEPSSATESRRWQLRNGLIVTLAAFVAVSLVSAVIVVVVLSVTSLDSPSSLPPIENVDVTQQQQVLTGVTSPVAAISEQQVPHPVVEIVWSEDCTSTVTGDVVNGLQVFKGIRYALAPTNELRWQAPVIFGPTASQCPLQIDARTFGSKCAQLGGSTDSDTDSDDGGNRVVEDDDIGDVEQPVVGSEDCLFINVWSPIDATGQRELRDVMVYIHDGGLMTGSGHEAEYQPDGELLREANVVLVSFNYRLNVFGFLALNELTSTDKHNSSGYYGLLDQITALQWVQQHIKAFGGNPDKVTVFGRGSGATSIFGLLASDLSHGLFSRAWLSNPSPKFESRRELAEQQNIDFLNMTGCAVNYTNERQVTDCLRSLSTKSVLHALPWQSWLNNHLYGIPTVDEKTYIIAAVDGFVLRRAPLQAWQTKTATDVPLLISSAAQLTDIMLTPGHLDKWQVEDYIKQRMQPFTDDINLDDVFDLYPVSESAEWCITTLVSDMRASCPLDQMAHVAAFNSHSPVYRYQVTYHRKDSQLPNGMNYAYRGIDVDAFFNAAGSPSSDWESLVHNVRHVVAQFVHNVTVQGWTVFPEASYNMSATISNATSPHFRSSCCDYWRTHGFYPLYAWMN